jgi:hypothetical protein
MFEEKRALLISSSVSKILGTDLWDYIDKICTRARIESFDEPSYFRCLFGELNNYLNSLKIASLIFKCKAVEVHQKPIVKYGYRKRCELGDYFLNVKYIDNGRIIGNKLVIYQFKRADIREKWKIDPKQLELLSIWPTFSFGRRREGVNYFKLSPKTKDLGSYWFASRRRSRCPVCSGIDVGFIKQGNQVSFSDWNYFFPFDSVAALVFHITWRYGEFVEEQGETRDFLNALYRYVGFKPDPPEEFIGYMTPTEDNKSFWGIEITVAHEGG